MITPNIKDNNYIVYSRQENGLGGRIQKLPLTALSLRLKLFQKFGSIELKMSNWHTTKFVTLIWGVIM